jgi:ABC-2 type transport system ATP-binding protein
MKASNESAAIQIDKFRSQGKTIIFVSHSPEAVKNICDRACVLDHGRMVFLGKSAEAIERYHQLLAQ